MSAPAAPTPLTIAVGSRQVSALLDAPPDARLGCVLAHGAGAGMRHPFLAAVATALAARRIATLRYQFPYVEAGSKRPDPPAVAHATVRAAVAAASARLPGLPLLAAGKSFGGRMTSQAQAAAPMPGVAGLVFLGFPLHPAGKPATDRAAHLDSVRVPMLFLQGTRDELADLGLIRAVTGRLATATRVEVDDADHGFHVRKRSGRDDAAVIDELADAIAGWSAALA
jgi:predicted alpha/beta-hydrolase family hydrolase